MSRISQRFSDLERAHKGTARVERAISRLIELEVPQSFETLSFFRTIDPALDFMITFPARSALQQQSPCPSGRRSILSSTQPQRTVRRARTYFHIPFCRDICKYCIFFVRYSKDDQAARYLNALQREWQLLASLPILETMVSRAVYVGGGTPTSLSLEHLDILTDIVRSSVSLERGAEYTVEHHPATLTHEKLDLLKRRGVNRISMGVESFDNQVLELCGRKGYTRDDVPTILEMIHDAGIRTVNIDMIYGLPGETLVKFADTLEYLIDLFDADLLTSVSWYPYTTGKKLPAWPKGHFLSDNLHMMLMSAMIRDAVLEELNSQECAVRHFEPRCYSNGAKKKDTVDWERFLRDNFSEYEDAEIGCGNNAYSYIDRAGHSYVNERGITQYIARVEAGQLPTATALPLTNQLKAERATLKACQVGVVNLTAIREAFHVDLLAERRVAIAQMTEHGLVETNDDQILITEKGRLNLEGVARQLAFLPDRYEALSGASATAVR